MYRTGFAAHSISIGERSRLGVCTGVKSDGNIWKETTGRGFWRKAASLNGNSWATFVIFSVVHISDTN
jgi:hypothetical protein